eukprot:14452803-Alexandrium_andersonii.AAC.1
MLEKPAKAAKERVGAFCGHKKQYSKGPCFRPGSVSAPSAAEGSSQVTLVTPTLHSELPEHPPTPMPYRNTARLSHSTPHEVNLRPIKGPAGRAFRAG